MKKFAAILTLALASTALADSKPVFGVIIQPGLMEPGQSFQFGCEIREDGHLASKLTKAKKVNGEWTWFVAEEQNRTLSPQLFKQMMSLLRKASAGRIDETPAPCDVGNRIYQGVLEDQDVTLDSLLNCGAHYLNTSSAAKKLVQILKTECKSPELTRI